jgi:hypothetical protein
MTPQEIRSIKNAATEYAKKFLTFKYHDEYQELYKAYCFNRGVLTVRGHSKVPIDERLVLIETIKGDNNGQ